MSSRKRQRDIQLTGVRSEGADNTIPASDATTTPEAFGPSLFDLPVETLHHIFSFVIQDRLDRSLHDTSPAEKKPRNEMGSTLTAESDAVNKWSDVDDFVGEVDLWGSDAEHSSDGEDEDEDEDNDEDDDDEESNEDEDDDNNDADKDDEDDSNEVDEKVKDTDNANEEKEDDEDEGEDDDEEVKGKVTDQQPVLPSPPPDIDTKSLAQRYLRHLLDRARFVEGSEHLLRCFFFSCKHLHQVLIAFTPLWKHLFSQLVLPSDNDDGFSSHSDNPETRDAETEALMPEPSFENYRQIMKQHMGQYIFCEDGVPLGETDGSLIVRVGPFAKAVWMGFGVGCGRAGEFFAMHACYGVGNLAFTTKKLKGGKRILAAVVVGNERDRDKDIGRRGRDWETWVSDHLGSALSRPPMDVPPGESSVEFRLNLKVMECTGGGMCQHWSENMEW